MGWALFFSKRAAKGLRARKNGAKIAKRSVIMVKPRTQVAMKDTELLSFFKRGLIPGPSETEEEFLKRAEASPPLPAWSVIEPLPSQWGFTIDWVPLVYSKKKLLPWEGALFFDDHIQLHPKLQTKNLFGNSLTEILHHESIHAARSAFHEPHFEEFLAYCTSPSWKRLIGPLFSRIWEFPLFAISLLFLPYALPIPLFFLARLFYKHHLFSRAKKALPLPVLLCMTDQEISTRFYPTKTDLPGSSLRQRLIALLLNS